MLKKLSQELTVTPIDVRSESDSPKSEIILHGKATGKIVPGVVLEAAIGWREFYLLMLSDDIPYEDALNIHLLDQDLNLLDSVTLGGIYTTGSFSSLTLNEPSRVGFRFIGDTDWVIELLPEPVFRMPFISDPRGVGRRFGFSRHFKVHGTPQPELA